MKFFSFMKSTGSSRKLGRRPAPTLPMSPKRPGPHLVQDKLLRVGWRCRTDRCPEWSCLTEPPSQSLSVCGDTESKGSTGRPQSCPRTAPGGGPLGWVEEVRPGDHLGSSWGPLSFSLQGLEQAGPGFCCQDEHDWWREPDAFWRQREEMLELEGAGLPPAFQS